MGSKIGINRKLVHFGIAIGFIFLASCGMNHTQGDPYSTEHSEEILIDASNNQHHPLDEFFSEADVKWNDSADYTNAILAFDQSYDEILKIAQEKEFECEPHFVVAYIDSDEIPELLVAYGNSHPEGISVYRYDKINDSTIYVGTFGSYGSLQYYEGSGIVVSYYGNMGSYSYYASRINDDNSVSLVDLWYVDGTGFSSDETLFYHGFGLIEEGSGIDGTKDTFEKLNLNELYVYGDISECNLISEDEYLLGYNEWMGLSEEQSVSVRYDDMLSLN